MNGAKTPQRVKLRVVRDQVDAAEPPTSATQAFAEQTLNDAGNKDRFVEAFAKKLIFAPEPGKWREWIGTRWRESDRAAMDAAIQVARMAFAAIARTTDPNHQEKLLKFGKASLQRSRLEAMIALAALSELRVPQDRWDTDPLLFGVENGVVNLKTLELLDPKPERYISKSAPITFDKDAECPNWLKFLGRIMDDDADMIAFLQRAVGYSMTGLTDEQCLLICHGNGANGKSIMLNVLLSLVGDYGRNAATSTLLVRRGEGINNDVARLAGARLVTSIETDKGKRLSEAFVKTVTGGDLVTARFLFREYFQFIPIFKLWLATNHRPEIRGTDHAIWRRIRLVPFEVTIPEDQQERPAKLLNRLKRELPGILNWALEGCIEWQRNGLQPPDRVIQATAAYRDEMDQVGRWVKERCKVDSEARVVASYAYADYKKWVEDNGENQHLSSNEFGALLRQKFARRDTNKGRYYVGVELRDDFDYRHRQDD